MYVLNIGKPFQKNQPNILLKKRLGVVIYLIEDDTHILPYLDLPLHSNLHPNLILIGKPFQKNQPNILLKKCLQAVIILIKDGTSILDENKAKESEIRDLYVAGIYVYRFI